MYDYKRFQMDILTKALVSFETQNYFDLDIETMDKVWDVSIKCVDNKNISKFFGRYYPSLSKIEIIPHMFKGNLIAYRDTVRHELAHHITDILYPNVTDHHGKEWRSICHLLDCCDKRGKNLEHFNLEWNQSKNIAYFEGFKL